LPEEPAPQQNSVYATRLAYTQTACHAWMLVSAVLASATLAVLVWTYQVYLASLRRQPLVVGYEPGSGVTRILNPEALRFHPTDETLRYFLLHFVREHCERTREVSRDYTHSLVFMDRRLTGARIEQDIRQIKQWQTGEGDEVRVKVLNVTVEDTRHGCQDGSPAQPCRARIDYEKTYYDRHTDREIARKAYAADVTFVLKSEVTNDMIADNPLGLVITDFHEFQGFE
jgi:type IV secretory pathway TrbF-like protein